MDELPLLLGVWIVSPWQLLSAVSRVPTHPITHSHHMPHSLPRPSQITDELLLLGSQPLSALADAVRCVAAANLASAADVLAGLDPPTATTAAQGQGQAAGAGAAAAAGGAGGAGRRAIAGSGGAYFFCEASADGLLQAAQINMDLSAPVTTLP